LVEPTTGRGDVRDDDVDDTVIRPRRGPVAAPDDDALGDTVIRDRPLPTDAAARPSVPVEPAPTARRVASIRLRDRVIALDRPVVLGRRPAGPRVAPRVAPELVVVPSPSGQVSGTHVTIHAEGDAVVVEDMRSTNGTFVRVPGAAPLRMRAGASMVVLTGTVVDIGDGNTIEILSPHQRIRHDGSVAGTHGVGSAVPPKPGPPGADPRGAGSPGLGSPEAERHTS
jgi:hypothetical protein